MLMVKLFLMANGSNDTYKQSFEQPNQEGSRRKETGIAKTARLFAFSSLTGFGNSSP